ncbi:hypothetical protein V5F72_06935 [Xanthobacter flavus]|uniref:hypothetical protein n=1 Tax=Xanthobacter flavus TaxID=281 RepID=UPI00372A642A
MAASPPPAAGRLSRRTLLAATGALLLPGLGAGRAGAADASLKVGYQDSTLPELARASGVFEGAPYTVEWVVLPGPAAQLTAAYSRAIDLAHLGDTSLIIEQGKSADGWAGGPPLQIIAGWRNLDARYPRIVTAVRTRTGAKTAAELKGLKWGFNFGGLNYVQYLLARRAGGLTTADIDPVQFGDGNAAATAFNADHVDVYSGLGALVGEAVEKGQARIVLTSDDLDIPALGVFAARTDAIADPARRAVLHDFVGRLARYFAWYADNLDAAERIYIDRVKQSPARARYYVEFGKARLRPIDAELIRREQKIADALLEAGAIPRTIDVSSEFNTTFNAAVN